MQTTEELLAEANQAFYDWEERGNITTMSDDDRIIFCIGYVLGKAKGELS